MLPTQESNDQTDSDSPSGDHVTSDQSDPKQSPSEDTVVGLQAALKEAEQQNNLLNLEYGRLLREKEVSHTHSGFMQEAWRFINNPHISDGGHVLFFV